MLENVYSQPNAAYQGDGNLYYIFRIILETGIAADNDNQDCQSNEKPYCENYQKNYIYHLSIHLVLLDYCVTGSRIIGPVELLRALRLWKVFS